MPHSDQTPAEWTPDGWSRRRASQPVTWPGREALAEARAELRRLPPLVAAGEAEQLRTQIAQAQAGRAFVLMAGDCAESLDELSADRVRDQLKLVLQMAVVLTFAAGVPVIKVGRVAGQFGKPRTELLETRGDTTLPSFRGHIINGEQFTETDRTPDPRRMVRGYQHSVAVLNLLRAFTSGGFADLGQLHAWNREFVRQSPEGARYEQLAQEIDRALRFVEACGHPMTYDSTRLFTAHEALVLDYEEQLTRVDSLSGRWFCCSAHFLWVGERTREIDGAHVEFARGINNPIGVKIGPDCAGDELVDLIRTLNPDRVPGRLTLIPRLGAARIDDVLPKLVDSVRDSGEPVAWVCDPMHGNTRQVQGYIKTRDFEDIRSELESFVRVLRTAGVWPAGAHFEVTADDVTECTGGSWPITEEVLAHNYQSLCDPRLNGRQALDMAFELARLIRR